MNMTVSGSYRPRRVRSSNPPPFQLTARDREIIELVARHRFLNSGHIRRLVAGSAKNITNRLKALFEHGYLDRPDCQYDTYRPGGGSTFITYALAERGARLLADKGDSGKRISWAHKNKSVGRPFLEHCLAIADFAVAMRLAVQTHDNVELVDGERLVQAFPTQTQTLTKPYRLTVPIIFSGGRVAVGVEPDYAFSLHLPKARRKAFFLVEIDRGTMPVERSDLRQTSILRKLLAYQALWKAKLHNDHFGWRNFRVLFVTSSIERALNMIEAMNTHGQTNGSPLFLFADKRSLYATDNMLAREWLDGYGNEQQLLPGQWNQ